MKLIKKSIDQYNAGFVVMRAQETEDLWHVYHLLTQGDLLSSKTFRCLSFLLYFPIPHGETCCLLRLSPISYLLSYKFLQCA
jgi:hypothetical protein